MGLTIRCKVVPLCMCCISFCSESSHNTAMSKSDWKLCTFKIHQSILLYSFARLLCFLYILKYKYLLGNSYSHTKAIPSKCMPQHSIHYHTSNRSQGRWQQRWLTWRNEIWISYLGFSFCSFVIQQIQPSSFRIIVFDHSIYLDLSGHVWFEISGYKPPWVCNLETSIFSVKAKVCNKITDQRWLSQPKLQLKANSICVLLNVLQQSKPDLDFPTEISEFQAQGLGILSQHFDQCADLFTKQTENVDKNYFGKILLNSVF